MYIWIALSLQWLNIWTSYLYTFYPYFQVRFNYQLTRSNSLRSMIWVFMEISHRRKLVVFGNANRICINIFLVSLAKYSSVILFKYTSHPEHFLYICRKSRNVNFKTLCLLTFYWMKFLWVFWDRMYNT